MKSSFATLALALLIFAAEAQEVHRTEIDFNGATYPAEVTEIPLPPAEAEKVIRTRMKSLGYSPGKQKGYLVYRNVQGGHFGGDSSHDLIYKIEGKGRKNPASSNVYLISAKAGEIPDGRVKGADKSLVAVTSSVAAASFLHSFHHHAGIHNHHLSVDAKSGEVKKATKKLDDLQKEQTKLEKRLKETQEALEKNRKQQETQNADLKKLQDELIELKQTAPTNK